MHRHRPLLLQLLGDIEIAQVWHTGIRDWRLMVRTNTVMYVLQGAGEALEDVPYECFWNLVAPRSPFTGIAFFIVGDEVEEAPSIAELEV